MRNAWIILDHCCPSLASGAPIQGIGHISLLPCPTGQTWFHLKCFSDAGVLWALPLQLCLKYGVKVKSTELHYALASKILSL